MATDHPLFIYRYMDRAEVRKDSARFRNRVDAAFNISADMQFAIEQQVQRRAGIVVRYGWNEFWTQGDLGDVLTAVTVAIQYTRGRGYTWSKEFRDAVGLAMHDENLGLRIDDLGVIHLGVDEDFEVVRLATLAGLDDPRLKDARNAYEAAFRYMDATPPDTRQAVRRVFEAVEIVARQLAPAHKNLHAALCRGELKSICVPALTNDDVEKQVLDLMFNGLAEWVSAMHFYRHGQPESTPPTLDTVVFAFSTGAGYLRLLAKVAVQKLP
jgi:hypothetical protein